MDEIELITHRNIINEENFEIDLNVNEPPLTTKLIKNSTQKFLLNNKTQITNRMLLKTTSLPSTTFRTKSSSIKPDIIVKYKNRVSNETISAIKTKEQIKFIKNSFLKNMGSIPITRYSAKSNKSNHEKATLASSTEDELHREVFSIPDLEAESVVKNSTKHNQEKRTVEETEKFVKMGQVKRPKSLLVLKEALPTTFSPKPQEKKTEGFANGINLEDYRIESTTTRNPLKRLQTTTTKRVEMTGDHFSEIITRRPYHLIRYGTTVPSVNGVEAEGLLKFQAKTEEETFPSIQKNGKKQKFAPTGLFADLPESKSSSTELSERNIDARKTIKEKAVGTKKYDVHTSDFDASDIYSTKNWFEVTPQDPTGKIPYKKSIKMTEDNGLSIANHVDSDRTAHYLKDMHITEEDRKRNFINVKFDQKTNSALQFKRPIARPLQKTIESQQNLSYNKYNILQTTRAKADFKISNSKSYALRKEDVDEAEAIIETTNTNMFNTNHSNSTVANYLNLIKTNVSQINANIASSSHLDKDNEVKIKIDNIDEEDIQTRKGLSNNLKYNDNDYSKVYKADDNDSKRRFQKYQLQRRTSTTASTTSTATTPNEAEGYNVAARSQVNLNDDKKSERETSTYIPETTIPITTEKFTSTAKNLPRRIKVLKSKRLVASNVNNINITTSVTANSATNLNVSHTDTQNILKPSSFEVEPLLSQTESLTEPEITQIQPPILSQTSSPKLKHMRKIIRKLVKPVEKEGKRHHNISRYGFNRSTNFTQVEEAKSGIVKKDDESPEKTKQEVLINRGRNRFTLPAAAAVTTRFSYFGSGKHNINRFDYKPHPSTTTIDPDSPKDHNDYTEDKYISGIAEYEEMEETTINPEHNNLEYPKLLASTTERTIKLIEENVTDINEELESTTSKDDIPEDISIKTGHPVVQSEVVLNDTAKFITTSRDSEDTLSKPRNKIKQDLAKMIKGEDELLSGRSKFIENESEEQEVVKKPEEKDVVNVKLKKLLETKKATTSLSNTEIVTHSTKDGLNLQKIRDETQTDLFKSDHDDASNSMLKKVLSETNSSIVRNTYNISADSKAAQYNSSTEVKDISGDDRISEANKSFAQRTVFIPSSKFKPKNNGYKSQTSADYDTATLASIERSTFPSRLVAKEPYDPNKDSLSALSTTTTRVPTTKDGSKYIRQKFRKFNSLNSGYSNTNDDFDHAVSKFNKNLPINRLIIEASAKDKGSEDYVDNVEEVENEELGNEEEEAVKPTQVTKPNLINPHELFNIPQREILKKPSIHLKDQNSGDYLSEDAEYEDYENETEDEDEDKEDQKVGDMIEEENVKQREKPSKTPPSYKPKENRVPPGARASFNVTTANKNFFTTSRIANTPHRPGAISPTIPGNKDNRIGYSAAYIAKPPGHYHILGVSVQNLTIKPADNNLELTTVLTTTKPGPNLNTRAYQRKYTGQSTEPSVNTNIENNPLIEDLNIEAINARNKKIFDTNSKKRTSLQSKVILPFSKQNDNTQEKQQQQINTEFENDDEDYQSSMAGFAATTITNTHTQQQEHKQEQSTTLGNMLISTQKSDDPNQSNDNNLNEISSQDGVTTTSSPGIALLHIFTLSDAEHTTQNLLDDAFQGVPRLIVERTKPKHKVVEINRIVEVNSKEEKLRRKSKANTIMPIEGSQTYKVERLPHVEQLGEISVVKYVHQVDGSDITVEGRSTVTNYTPTEPSVAGSSQPLHYILPDYIAPQRYGKALLPEVLRESVETSTISLEGLFEKARKGKVLTTIDESPFIRANIDNDAEKVRITENSTVSLSNIISESSTFKPTEKNIELLNAFQSIAFDDAKINLEINSDESGSKKPDNAAIFLEPSSSFSPESDQQILTTTSVPRIFKQKSSTATLEDAKASTAAATLFPQYVRPIVPLLRPESNESSPLVISIANLDKVILSKVNKIVNVEIEEDQHHHEFQSQQKQENNTEPPNTTPHYYNQPRQQNSDIHDSQADFSSRLTFVMKAPLKYSLTKNEKHFPKVPNVAKPSLEKAQQATQTDLYTINEGNVSSTTGSANGSKISETVSFSSETTVVRHKQPRKAKSDKLKNATSSTNASATQ